MTLNFTFLHVLTFETLLAHLFYKQIMKYLAKHSYPLVDNQFVSSAGFELK